MADVRLNKQTTRTVDSREQRMTNLPAKQSPAELETPLSREVRSFLKARLFSYDVLAKDPTDSAANQVT